MREWFYKMQLAHYDRAAFRALKKQITTGQPQWTPRLRRLRRLTWLLCLLGAGLPLLFPAGTVQLANTLLTPYEKWRNRRFIRRAQRKLAQMPQLIRIGITGSYGKTSVKNILCAMLRTRYRVVASPASFNTPLGFARTVLENLPRDTEVLIMEMGARQPDDIAAMCALVRPQHGIITSIGACHLATLGSIAQVRDTKAALFRALPADGVAVTDGDNPWCQQLTHPRLVAVQSATAPVYATPLLGAHQQKNIQLAAALARALGVSEPNIRLVAANLTPTPHRLEKIVAPNGIIILDDSYNANPASAASALAVLGTFNTKKVVQTPGFVEQGAYTTAAHATLCQQLRAVADAVIVVGTVNQAAFQRGLAGWSRPVYYVPNRDAAQKLYPQLLHAGEVLLLLNDLPENY